MKCIFVLVEFKHTEIFTFYEGYLLNTKPQVPGVGLSVAGLDRAKLGVYQFSDQTRIKPLLKRLKNVGMASEKLYSQYSQLLRYTKPADGEERGETAVFTGKDTMKQ